MEVKINYNKINGGGIMEVNIEQLYDTLRKSETIVLSTSKNDYVTSRLISPLVLNDKLYIKTSNSTEKVSQLEANPNVAMNVAYFSLTGVTNILGSVEKEENKDIKENYMKRYIGSFNPNDEYQAKDDIFIEISIKSVSQWFFENDEPIGFAIKEL